MEVAFDSMSETSAVLINVTSIDGTLTNRYQVITDHTKVSMGMISKNGVRKSKLTLRWIL